MYEKSQKHSNDKCVVRSRRSRVNKKRSDFVSSLLSRNYWHTINEYHWSIIETRISIKILIDRKPWVTEMYFPNGRNFKNLAIYFYIKNKNKKLNTSALFLQATALLGSYFIFKIFVLWICFPLRLQILYLSSPYIRSP